MNNASTININIDVIPNTNILTPSSPHTTLLRTPLNINEPTTFLSF